MATDSLVGFLCVHRRILEWIDAGRPFALLVVLDADGSTPTYAGAKAIVDVDGMIQGTIGGGPIEATAQRLAREAIQTGRPAVLDFPLTGASASAEEPLCGGFTRILVHPAPANDRLACARACEALERRERGILLTTVTHAPGVEVRARWIPEEAIVSHTGLPGVEDLRLALRREVAQCVTFEGEQAGRRTEVLIEPAIPKPVLLIAGGGHIGQALARVVAPIGFDIAVIDDRPEFADSRLYPQGVKTCCADIASVLEERAAGEDTYVVIVTRGHRQDAAALEACIRKPLAYLGMIGSRRKVALMREDFIASGRATAERFDRVRAPIGLPIGAVTVTEIAISIAAQLVDVRRKRMKSP